MNSIILLAVGLLFFVATVAILAPGRNNNKSDLETLIAKRPLTEHEQTMYFRLLEALPKHIVLAQVSFSAIIDSSHFATRGTFNQKTADFVVCDNTFNVLACIELDDSSHDKRKRQDAQRDAMLRRVGHRVLRYRRVPDTEKLRADVLTTRDTNKSESNETQYS